MYELDEIDTGMGTFSVSSFDVIAHPLIWDTYLIYMVDPVNGFLLAQVHLNHPPFYVFVSTYSLYTMLAPYYVTPANTFTGISVYLTNITANGTEAYVQMLVTTQDSNHFDISHTVNASNFTVQQIYQRYAALQVINRLRATPDYFVVYGMPENVQVGIKNWVFLAYDRTVPDNWNSTVLLKNVFAGLPYQINDISTVNYDLVSFTDNTTNETIQSFIISSANSSSPYLWASYDFLDQVGVQFLSSDLNSANVEIVVSNDFGSQSVTLKINNQTWFRKNLLWLILGATVIILVIAIVIGCRVCNKAANEAGKQGLLED